MSRRRTRSLYGFLAWTAVLAAELGVGSSAGAQAPLLLGGQFQVNTYTADNQVGPSISVDATGSFVVVWRGNGSAGTDTSAESIHGQRYSTSGAALGAEFQINTYTTSAQIEPSVATDSDGDFVVVWESNGSLGTDTSLSSIQGQRYASSGAALGAQFQVNTYTTSRQGIPAVTADADGDFVVVWRSTGSSGTDFSSYSIQGQRYASSGATVGTQFQVNTYTSNNQVLPSVSVEDNGDFVVAWQSYGSSGTDPSGYSIQGQRYASSGAAVGAQFQVNAYTTGNQFDPSVGMDAAGNFVVAWLSYGSSGSDTSYSSIQGQRYASGGSAVGAQFQINSYTTSIQFGASIGVGGDGDFVVTWTSDGSLGTDPILSIQGQRYASDGSAQGVQFQVNSYTTSSQYTSSVASAPDGRFVVAWDSLGSPGNDNSALSIQAQRYRPPIVAPAMSAASRVALGAALMLLGATYALRRR